MNIYCKTSQNSHNTEECFRTANFSEQYILQPNSGRKVCRIICIYKCMPV